MKKQHKTIILTGGTRGIGKAIAGLLIKENIHLIITGTSRTPSYELPSQVEGRVEFVSLDLNSPDSVDEFLNYVERLDNVHGLINNAGVNRIDHLVDISDKDYDEVMTVNLLAPFKLSRAVAKKMIANNVQGKIVNIGSIWSVISKRGRVSYISSKAGLAGLTRGLATDLGEYNILVNAISPGFVMTELTRNSLSQKEIEQLAEQVPLKRLAEPEEIAKFVQFLMSDDNTYMTGQNIVVDGGFTHV